METSKRRSLAQITALEDVVKRLRAGEMVSETEMQKMRKRVGLLNSHYGIHDDKDSLFGDDATSSTSQKATAWKEVIMGKAGATNVTEEQELSEWNKEEPQGKVLTLFPQRQNVKLAPSVSTDTATRPAAAVQPVERSSQPQSTTSNPRKPIFY
ncbi:13296_t:CDS:2 [Acaulospora colombiana]|uniref:13296_t:CDS:1 n=1 Tax=Acaulospora colombiana TaxID=27376 RepID=A0ACA9MZQ9_9GLOM|nr:13296_t:CDS:2 [Acaulospora colombiana]